MKSNFTKSANQSHMTTTTLIKQPLVNYYHEPYSPCPALLSDKHFVPHPPHLMQFNAMFVQSSHFCGNLPRLSLPQLPPRVHVGPPQPPQRALLNPPQHHLLPLLRHVPHHHRLAEVQHRLRAVPHQLAAQPRGIQHCGVFKHGVVEVGALFVGVGPRVRVERGGAVFGSGG